MLSKIINIFKLVPGGSPWNFIFIYLNSNLLLMNRIVITNINALNNLKSSYMEDKEINQ